MATTETIDGIAVVELDIKALDADTVDPVRTELDEAVATTKKVVLDLHSLTFIDSSGLGIIIAAMRHARAAGGDVKLCRLAKQVRAMFVIVRMHRVIDLFESRQEAVKSFGGSA